MPQRTKDNELVKRLLAKVENQNIRILMDKMKRDAPRGEYAFPILMDEYCQKSMVKVSYTENKHNGHWKTHGRYISRKGTQRVDQKALGFNHTGDSINIARRIASWEKSDDEIMFRLRISPEQGHKLDLKHHAKKLMERVEIDFGCNLQWLAIDHYDTVYSHLHIVIRGSEEDGSPLRIAKRYINEGFRKRSEQIATQQLGFRLEPFALDRRKLAISHNHVTELDHEIERKLGPENKITLEDVNKLTLTERERRSHIIGRLDFLEAKGFAKKLEPATWKLVDNFKQGLKTYQLSRDIVRCRAQNLGRISDPRLPLVYSELKPNDRLVGRLLNSGSQSSKTKSGYLLIEGLDRKVHYIIVPLELVNGEDALRIRRDDIVSLEMKEVLEPKRGRVLNSLKVENWRSFHWIRQHGSPEADEYILENASRIKSHQFGIGVDRTSAGQFYSWGQKRLRDLQAPLKRSARVSLGL